MSWKNIPVLVTGGASFIGSHLVDELVKKGARVRIVDNLSSGKKENIKSHLQQNTIEFIKGDLLFPVVAKRAVKGISHVFHLAALHGGRGYVDTHQAACVKNVLLDTLLIDSAYHAGVKQFTFASSGCVYPNYLQGDIHKEVYLSEHMIGPPYEPDNMYGWAKLTTEKALRAYFQDYHMSSASCRFFTVYGDRGVENHAIIAMIAKAFIHQNPFEIWGDGTQVRNWTYVDDIVTGMLQAAEKIHDGSAINLGTMERIRVIDAANMICDMIGYKPQFLFQTNKPTGPYNRICDNSLAKKRLDWEPKILFSEGVKKTINWYITHKKQAWVRQNLPVLLMERNIYKT
jgi:nucleoside-diphosphate-sugar epimerase